MILKKIWEKNKVLEKKIDKKDVLQTENFNVAVVSLEEGQEIDPHPEPYGVFFLILEGTAIFTNEQGKIALSENSSIYYKKNEVRGIKSETKLTLLAIHDPHQ